MKKGIIYTIMFTLAVSFIFVFFLSVANELTKDITEKNAELALGKTVLKAFNIPFTKDNAYSLYTDTIKIIQKADTNLYVYKHQDTTDYAILFSGMGLWGQIQGILAVNDSVTMIVGIEFLSHNETPGLGGRIDEEIYKEQFQGEFLNKDGKIVGTRNGTYDYNHQNSIIDGITGASRTSDSVVTIVNHEVSRLRTLLGAN
ncbi:MAG: FMN-binding protein [Spirochaetales bacterium]|nr:FMN-binding protein [Spirochaetales bacterium]